MLNNRCIEVLKYLIRNKEEKFVEELSNKFDVSKRMIRYDIDSINIFLKSNNLSEIKKKANSPLKINYNEKDKVIKLLDELSTDAYILSNEERIGIILYELLRSQKECTYLRLQNILLVSKSTIVSDLKKVKEWLQEYNIEVYKYSNKGIKVTGNEVHIRRAMTAVLIGSNKYNIIQTLEKIYSKENSNIINNAKNLKLPVDTIEYIKELVEELEDELGIFTDKDFMSIVYTVFVIITRNKDDNLLKDNHYNDLKSQYKKEYSAAEKVAVKLLDKFGININSEDISYLTSIIVSISKNANDFLESKDYFLACSIANTICNNIEAIYSKSIKMDKALYESFINHIKGLVFRLKFRISTKNEIISTIKNTYTEDFIIVKKSCEFLEEKFKYTISDDEIGFITLYICSAIEKNKEEIKNRKNILIVCSQGFTTGKILESKIKRYFDVTIVAVTALHAIDKYLINEKIDFIITTLNIEENYNVQSITVSPILGENDIELLKKYLKYRPLNNKLQDVNNILKIIENYCEIKDINGLINDLNNYLNIKNKDVIEENKEIVLSNIQLNLEANSWEEAIYLSAMPLLNNGMITEEYIKDMIENVNKYGAYIVVDENIAIPHAKSNNSINNSCFSISTFKNPISIGDHENVRIFIVLAIAEEERKVQFISSIMKLIEDETFVDTILNAKYKNYIFDYIKLKL